MKGFGAVGLPAVLLLFACNGLAQSLTITTYVASTLPVSGAQAITQAIDYPASVVSDGAGGFCVPSSAQDRIYHEKTCKLCRAHSHELPENRRRNRFDSAC